MLESPSETVVRSLAEFAWGLPLDLAYFGRSGHSVGLTYLGRSVLVDLACPCRYGHLELVYLDCSAHEPVYLDCSAPVELAYLGRSVLVDLAYLGRSGRSNGFQCFLALAHHSHHLTRVLEFELCQWALTRSMGQFSSLVRSLSLWFQYCFVYSHYSLPFSNILHCWDLRRLKPFIMLYMELW